MKITGSILRTLGAGPAAGNGGSLLWLRPPIGTLSKEFESTAWSFTPGYWTHWAFTVLQNVRCPTEQRPRAWVSCDFWKPSPSAMSAAKKESQAKGMRLRHNLITYSYWGIWHLVLWKCYQAIRNCPRTSSLPEGLGCPWLVTSWSSSTQHNEGPRKLQPVAPVYF